MSRCTIETFPEPVAPFPGWTCRVYALTRPVTGEDIAAFLGDGELVVRETEKEPVVIIHKFGILEIHCMKGERRLLVWSDPSHAAWAGEYLDALVATRF